MLSRYNKLFNGESNDNPSVNRVPSISGVASDQLAGAGKERTGVLQDLGHL